MRPSLATKDPYGVALVGEALGEEEAKEGAPFVGRAGFKLTRLIEWAGLSREQFDIWNVVWCRPPENRLEGAWYEHPAIQHCQAAHWRALLNRVRVLVPMGNVALGALTGQKGILLARGYVQPGPNEVHILPTVHPSFIQRGQSKYSAPFIHDLQRAVHVAQHGLDMEPVDYLLDPLPHQAMSWAKMVLAEHPKYLSFDIETPYKGDDEGELADDDDPTYRILRIGFAVHGRRALSIPFDPAYFAVVRCLLNNPGDKVVWNGGFDIPRLHAAGFPIRGIIHDGMVAWHILHSDLPKGLGFVSTFTCPDQPRWKHLSGSRPAFYNATDADVEVRSMYAIEGELRRVGLWGVYQRDVLDLDPVLRYMERRGMRVDEGIRADRAIQLDQRLRTVAQRMESAVPLLARKIAHVYKKEPKDTSNLLRRQVMGTVRVCNVCGELNPKKPHFKSYVKRRNPCAGASVVERPAQVDEWYRLAPFKPSREQLIRYQQALNRPIPTTYDSKLKKRKASMDEKAIKRLISKYPNDILYPSVLEYRELDKLAGTYIGRPHDQWGDESRA